MRCEDNVTNMLSLSFTGCSKYNILTFLCLQTPIPMWSILIIWRESPPSENRFMLSFDRTNLFLISILWKHFQFFLIAWKAEVAMFFVCFFLLLYIYTPFIPHTLQADTLQKCNNVIVYQKLGPICCGLKWFYLPVNVVLISRMAKLCRTIRTTLSDNWKLLVRPMKLAVETSSCLCIKVKSQESIVKSQNLREKSQESRVKNQESRVKSQESRVKSKESTVKNQESRVNSNYFSYSNKLPWIIFVHVYNPTFAQIYRTS